jgi:hypothetical protein
MPEVLLLQRIRYAGQKIVEYYDISGGTNPKEGFENIKAMFWGQSEAYKQGKL